MARETKSWRVLCQGPHHVEAAIAAELDLLEELHPITYAPELMPTIMALLFRGWLDACRKQGLINQSESERYFVALRDADIAGFRESPEFQVLMNEVAALTAEPAGDEPEPTDRQETA